MKIKFLNGVIKKCEAPTEQKVFRNSDNDITESAWVLTIRLADTVTSDELDEIILPENTSTLKFYTDENIEIFTLNGYNKTTFAKIRYSETISDENSDTYADIQLSKGVN